MGFREWLLRDLRAERADAHGASGQGTVLDAEQAGRRRLGARDHDAPIGLALSGGGIRSATFGLGVLQSLARAGKLPSFDYLSTVSGGGYIGSWLSAWIHRSSLGAVQSELARSASTSERPVGASEPRELRWLRSYSNYLTPRLGLLSQDSLTLIAIWFRNFLLNLIVFVAFVATLLMIPRLLLPWARAGVEHYGLSGDLAALLGIVAIVGIGYNLAATRRRLRAGQSGLAPAQPERQDGWGWLTSPSGVVCAVVAPVSGAILFGACWLLGRPDFATGAALSAIFKFAGALVVMLGVAWVLHELLLMRKLPRRPWRTIVVYGIALCAGTLVAGTGLVLVRQIWDPLEGGSKIDIVRLVEAFTFGPVAFLAVSVIATSVYVGLVGRRYFERSREWWARLNATLLTIALAWLAVCALSFYAWPVVEMAAKNAKYWLSALGAGWVGSLFTALFLRPDKGASDFAVRWRGVAANLAAWVVVAGLLLATAFAVSRLYVAGAGIDVKPLTAQTTESSLSLQIAKEPARVEANVKLQEAKVVPLGDYVAARLKDMEDAGNAPGARRFVPVGYAWVAFGAGVVVLLLFGWRVDVNKFSLHNLYKNRLVRCYLGASNARRAQQPFTGLDDSDDLPLKDLARPTGDRRCQRPYHLVNATLNITHGRHLAWQERKAASFVFTPLYCGFALGGAQDEASGTEAFQPTADFGGQDREEPGITLGSALATSGAAVSPNMGFSSDPAVAALLTLFNVRVGRWTGNPHGDRYDRPGPRFGLLCFLQELFGFSNEERRYVYLSDGGHFDNLGLYELVRRRCRLIVVVDAGADPLRKFDDLGMAIRKCRIDFGVEIEVPVEALRPQGTERLARESWALGRIRYPAGGGREASEGMLVYLKPTLCAGRAEPPDVLAYAAQNPDFPHQTTVDQFFGESQFESYRRLGQFIGERCMAGSGGFIPEPPRDWDAPVPDDRRDAGGGPPPASGPVPVRWKLALAAVIASLVALTALDVVRHQWVQVGIGDGCYSGSLKFSGIPAGCMKTAQELLKAPSPDRATKWLWADNAFVLLYAATFALAAVAACRAIFFERVSRLRILLLGAVTALAVLGALADFAENFQLLNAIGAESARTAAEHVAAATVWKWRLLTIAALILLVLVVWAARRDPDRRKGPPGPGPLPGQAGPHRAPAGEGKGAEQGNPSAHLALVLVHGIGDLRAGAVTRAAVDEIHAILHGVRARDAAPHDLLPREDDRAEIQPTSFEWGTARIDLIEFHWAGIAGKIRLRRPLETLCRFAEVVWEFPSMSVGKSSSRALRWFAASIGFVLAGLLVAWVVALAGSLLELTLRTEAWVHPHEHQYSSVVDGLFTLETRWFVEQGLYGTEVARVVFFAFASIMVASLVMFAVLALASIAIRRLRPLGVVLRTSAASAIVTYLTFGLTLLPYVAAVSFVGHTAAQPARGVGADVLIAGSFLVILWIILWTPLRIANLMRDIVHYLGTGLSGAPLRDRDRIHGALGRLLDQLYRQPTITGVVLVCHSLGTVIAADLLLARSRAAGPGRAVALHLVTAGSPIRRLINFLLPHRLPRPGDIRRELGASPLPLARWFNAYRVLDYVGGRLTSRREQSIDPGRGIRECPLTPRWKRPWGHANYWADPRFVSLVAAEVLAPLLPEPVAASA